MIRKAVFPAAGFGTRFLPATKASPKEMLPLVDIPLIQHGVEEAKAAGMRDMIIVTGRGKNVIEDHFDVSFELEAMLKNKGDAALSPPYAASPRGPTSSTSARTSRWGSVTRCSGRWTWSAGSRSPSSSRTT